MMYALDILSIVGMVIFFRIPVIISGLYASGDWLTLAPERLPKPWEGLSLW